MSRRVTQLRKLWTVRIARKHLRDANGDKDVFEKNFKEDPRVQSVKAIDPALVVLLIQLAMAVWKYFSERQVSADSPESDQDVLTGALRYFKG